MEDYLASKNIGVILKELVIQLGTQKPDLPVTFMVNYLKSTSWFQNEKKLNQSMEFEEEESDIDENNVQPTVPLRRRGGVSGESIDQNATFVKRVIPKTEEQRNSLANALKNHAMFSHLDDTQKAEVYDAMIEVSHPANHVIIKQGDEGDNFYVIAEGECKIFVASLDPTNSGEEEMSEYGRLVGQIGKGGCFGELALMYGSPRAATVVASTNVRLWAVDRVTFRGILMQTTLHKRKLYEKFLSKVPLLQTLTNWERMTVADALELRTFADGEIVIHEGEVGHSFYIVIEGEAQVFNKENGSLCIAKITASDYFGELALLTDRPRAASVLACGTLKCAVLTRECFNRVLGPVEDILRRNTERYRRYMTEKI